MNLSRTWDSQGFYNFIFYTVSHSSLFKDNRDWHKLRVCVKAASNKCFELVASLRGRGGGVDGLQSPFSVRIGA